MLPDWTVSMPADWAEPIPLSDRHWYTPSSCGVTSIIRREEPKIWNRFEGVMGSVLNNQVTLGVGFPLAKQLKWAEEPGGTDWSVRPRTTEARSVDQ